MIHQMDSHRLNTIIEEAQNSVDSAHEKIHTTQQILANKLEIIDAETNYQDYCAEKLKLSQPIKAYTASLFDTSYGIFSKFYFDVHAKFIKKPFNLFNLTVPSLAPVYFREDVTLTLQTVDGQTMDITGTLKHDSLQSSYFFKKFNTNKLTLSLQIKDYQKTLGPTRFNVIELDSFLNGSYTIESIVVYDALTIKDGGVSSTVLKTFPVCGKNHIVCDQKHQFSRIDFNIVLNYHVLDNDTTVYPFGIKHLYLLDADFDANSHAIVKITTDNTIKYVKNECQIYSNRETLFTTLKEKEIKLYLEYENNTLSMPFEMSTPSHLVELPKRTTTIYAHVPLKASDCFSSISFAIETYD